MSPPDAHHLPATRLMVTLACILALAMAGARAYEWWRQPRWIADGEGGGHWSRWPCEDAAASFCGGLARGNGRVNACLRQHEPELPPLCLNYLEEVDPSDDWSNVCRQELSTFCSATAYAVRCLRENVTLLSPRCAAQLRNYSQGSRWRLACGEDARRLCDSLEENEEAAGACLRSHRSDLSTSCRIYYGSSSR